jgi:RNA polymerase sigma factor (sigma-70 family)
LRQQQKEILKSDPPGTTSSSDSAAIDAQKVLDGSKPLHRAVLEAHYMQGLTAVEIAEAEGVSEGAIRLRLLRARRNVKKRVKRAQS